jgi:hypothetical protein
MLVRIALVLYTVVPDQPDGVFVFIIHAFLKEQRVALRFLKKLLLTVFFSTWDDISEFDPRDTDAD